VHDAEKIVVSDPLNLDYATPVNPSRTSKFAIATCALAAVGGPIGGQLSDWIKTDSATVFWITRFFPDIIAVGFSIASIVHNRRNNLRGTSIAVTGIVLTLFYALCAMAAPM
jgi:hypothetical protein